MFKKIKLRENRVKLQVTILSFYMWHRTGHVTWTVTITKNENPIPWMLGLAAASKDTRELTMFLEQFFEQSQII